jgi:hypothetical protein
MTSRGLDGNDDRFAAVSGVEVRQAVLAVVHRDDDPVERADPWHALIVVAAADVPVVADRAGVARRPPRLASTRYVR